MTSCPQKNYTIDRVNERELFQQVCKKLKDENDEKYVINYYGINGIGKSHLLDQLKQELDKKFGFKNIFLDLTSHKNPLTALVTMRQLLMEKPNVFSFPLFDYAYYEHLKKSGCSVEHYSPAARNWLDSSPILNCVLECLTNNAKLTSDNPVLNKLLQFLPHVTNAIPYVKLATECMEELNSWKYRRKEEIKDIQKCNISETRTKLLVDYFARDLNANLSGHWFQEKNSRLVVFIDSYPQYEDDLSEATMQSWLFGLGGLISQVPHVLWVIASDNPLCRGNIDPRWKKIIVSSCLECFSQDDTNVFLRCSGVTDCAIQNHIYNLTHGHPYHLQLCVDRFKQLQEQGQQLTCDSFHFSSTELLAKIIGDLRPEYKEVLLGLSCLGVWNDDLIKTHCSELINSHFLVYEQLKRLSLITSDQEGNYYVHSAVEGAVEEALYTFYPIIIERADDCLDAAFCKMDPFACLYHTLFEKRLQRGLKGITNEEELLIFFNKKLVNVLSVLENAGQYEFVNHCYVLLLEKAANWSNGMARAFILLSYADFVVRNTDDAKKAQNCIAEAQKIYSEAKRTNYEFVLQLKNTQANLFSAQGDYKAALRCREMVYRELKENLGDTHSFTLSAKSNLAVAYFDQHRFSEALIYQQELYAQREYLPSESQIFLVEGNLANTLLALKRYDEALEHHRHVLIACREMHNENHPDVIAAESNLANTLAECGRYDESYKYRLDAYQRSSTVFGENDMRTIKVEDGLATCLFAMGKKQEALEHTQHVYEHYCRVYGFEHEDTIALELSLGNRLSYVGKHEIALKHFLHVWKYYCKNYGISDFKALMAENNLASAYYNLHEIKKALKHQKHVFKERQLLLGEEHIMTLKAKNILEVYVKYSSEGS